MKPKLAIFITRLDGGGAEKVVCLLLEALKNRYDIHVILTVLTPNMPVIDGIKVFFVTKTQHAAWLNFAKIPFLAYRYKRYLEQNEIPISLSFLFRPNLIATAARLLGWRGKVIVSERSSPIAHYSSFGKSGKLILFLIRKLYPKADLILPNSYGTRNVLEKDLNIKTQYQVIYNPLDIEKTHAEAQRDPLSKNAFFDPFDAKNHVVKRFKYVCISNLHIYKNQQLIVKAMDKLRDLNIELWLIGGGTEEANLRQLVKKLNLEDRIYIVGYDPQGLIYMKNADCFVTGTNVEGFPNAQIEALCLGLPVISTDCMSGPRELLAPDTNCDFMLSEGYEKAEFGILTTVNDVDALAAAMKEIYENNTLRETYQNRGKKRAEDFSKNIIIEEFSTMINKYYS